ncbi:MAG: fibronectin type III domain-containing protein [bacterium]
MAQFPTTEAEVLALAQNISAGLTANPGVFPAPPVAPVDLSTAIATYVISRTAATDAQAQAELAIGTKNDNLNALIDAMKDDLRYAENTVDFDDDQLKLLGWGGRHSRTSLEPPGQPRTLEAPREGEGWIFLDWKEPTDGGAVAAYKVQRRERPDGNFLDVGTALESEITLVDQERGREWEYRIIAVNKAGESEPSNTVMAVL